MLPAGGRSQAAVCEGAQQPGQRLAGTRESRRGRGKLPLRIALEPGDAEIRTNLGIVQRLLGRSADAEASCRTALESNPDSHAAIAFLAELHADKGQFADAEGLYRRAIPSCRFASSLGRHRRPAKNDGRRPKLDHRAERIASSVCGLARRPICATPSANTSTM